MIKLFMLLKKFLKKSDTKLLNSGIEERVDLENSSNNEFSKYLRRLANPDINEGNGYGIIMNIRKEDII